jgi:hypothetical protein
MSMTIWESLVAEGERRGALRIGRLFLRDILEGRFGELPKTLKDQIESMTDSARLRTAHRQSLKIESLDELQL